MENAYTHMKKKMYEELRHQKGNTLSYISKLNINKYSDMIYLRVAFVRDFVTIARLNVLRFYRLTAF